MEKIITAQGLSLYRAYQALKLFFSFPQTLPARSLYRAYQALKPIVEMDDGKKKIGLYRAYQALKRLYECDIYVGAEWFVSRLSGIETKSRAIFSAD